MNLVRWDPFRELANLQNSVSRLFDEHYLRPFERANLTQGWMFPVDIKDTPEAVTIRAELPGMEKKDINVSFNDNVLTIRGERRKEEKEEGSSFVRMERSYGSFSRSFSLDVPVKPDEIKARYENGILEVIMAKDKKPVSEKNIEIE